MTWMPMIGKHRLKVEDLIVPIGMFLFMIAMWLSNHYQDNQWPRFLLVAATILSALGLMILNDRFNTTRLKTLSSLAIVFAALLVGIFICVSRWYPVEILFALFVLWCDSRLYKPVLSIQNLASRGLVSSFVVFVSFALINRTSYHKADDEQAVAVAVVCMIAVFFRERELNAARARSQFEPPK